MAAQVLGVEVIAVQVRHEQVVGPPDRVPVEPASAELSGNGNHEAKNAGFTHGSVTMLPCAVSISMLAWPSPVTAW